MYDFDKVIDRRGTDCVKFDRAAEVFGRGDVLPLWVADMDFATPDFIIDALRRRLDHPVLGYQCHRDDYFDAVVRWVEELHGWKVSGGWLRFIPGIVKGIALALQVFTSPGDKVVIQTPVYHPFRLVPQRYGREIVCNPLILDGDTYRMDFKGLESVLDGGCRMLILANPHNPAGILWSREDLSTLADICAERGVVVISDEIHAEMAHCGARHIPFASVSDRAASCSVTFMAPSKTFNIAGVVSSYAIVPDPVLRERFYSFLDAGELAEPGIFSAEAALAAYTHGAQWRRQMLGYVWDNVLYVEERLRGIEGVGMMRPQASFLIWLDCRQLLGRLVSIHGMEDADPASKQALLDSFFVEKAHLGLNSGMMFSSDGGSEGLGFMRLNVGSPRSVLVKAMDMLEKAVAGLA